MKTQQTIHIPRPMLNRLLTYHKAIDEELSVAYYKDVTLRESIEVRMQDESQRLATTM